MKFKSILIQNIFILLLLTIVSANIYAQKRPKYEDELGRLLNITPSEALAILKIYRQIEPENPSISLQMALIYEKRFTESDFLTQYNRSIGNANEAVASLNRAFLTIDEKEVRKSKEQYLNFAVFDAKGKYEVPWDSVKNKMDNSLAYATTFLENMPSIYRRFTSSFFHYQEANKIFTKVVGRYRSLKDMYLLYNSSLEGELDELSMHYDSAMYHFDKYKEATTIYPLKGYDQKLDIKDIAIYRLDGLEVEINFLVPEIRIWNYKKWANEVKSYVSVNIEKLRSDLVAEELKFRNKLKSVEQEFSAQEYLPLKTSKETMFNLKKYDLASVVEPLFLYKEIKHDLLYNKLLSTRLDSAQNIEADRRLFLYGQMINRIREADSILVTVKTRNTSASYDKYKPFVDKHYDGISGINNFVNNEQLNNRQDFSAYISSLNRTLIENYAVDKLTTQVSVKKLKYSLEPSDHPLDSMVALNPFTTHRAQNFDGSTYLAGVQMNSKEKKIETFLIKLDSTNKVLWINSYLLQSDSTSFDCHTRIGAIQTTQEGLLLVLHGQQVENGNHINHLLSIDDAGTTLLSKRLLFEDFPRGIFFHEKTNSYTINFKGLAPQESLDEMSELIIANHNIYGDLNWQYRMSIAGVFEKMVAVDDGYILANNYTSYKNNDGRIIRKGSGLNETAPLLMKIGLDGKFVNSTQIDSSQPLFGNTLVRISDSCINLLGIKGPYSRNGLTKDQVPNSFHVIFDTNLQIISSTAE